MTATVISSACGAEKHAKCETPWCGCMCHEPGGSQAGLSANGNP